MHEPVGEVGALHAATLQLGIRSCGIRSGAKSGSGGVPARRLWRPRTVEDCAEVGDRVRAGCRLRGCRPAGNHLVFGMK